MNPHLKLFPRIFVDKRRSVNRVLFDFGRWRNWTLYLGIITKRRVYNLLNRYIQDLGFISPDSNAQTRSCLLRLRDFEFEGLLFFNRLFDSWFLFDRCFRHFNLRYNFGNYTGPDSFTSFSDSETLFILKSNRGD